ncbi:hypothetical protein BDK51DRAFT_47765 [Blyttiomyces helicus]|uniref:Uncharacterized protein n=1 Tax=Blyttiomyces helicus TaxID=388810 RepID=A0A4P9W489_9FUNG|nr:hypothetical protein BDK51DRAFT_47765 [Blyttiomyces helicus]|eukprot:RKO85658.1 hypothetical protein BDK51DRAFT_47765 [Blyttiomyces helicus]
MGGAVILIPDCIRALPQRLRRQVEPELADKHEPREVLPALAARPSVHFAEAAGPAPWTWRREGGSGRRGQRARGAVCGASASSAARPSPSPLSPKHSKSSANAGCPRTRGVQHDAGLQWEGSLKEEEVDEKGKRAKRAQAVKFPGNRGSLAQRSPPERLLARRCDTDNKAAGVGRCSGSGCLAQEATVGSHMCLLRINLYGTISMASLSLLSSNIASLCPYFRFLSFSSSTHPADPFSPAPTNPNSLDALAAIFRSCPLLVGLNFHGPLEEDSVDEGFLEGTVSGQSIMEGVRRLQFLNFQVAPESIKEAIDRVTGPTLAHVLERCPGIKPLFNPS